MHGEKLMVYFAMVFAIVLELIQMRYTKNYREWTAKKNLEMMRAKGFDPQRTDTLELAQAIYEAERAAQDAKALAEAVENEPAEEKKKN